MDVNDGFGSRILCEDGSWRMHIKTSCQDTTLVVHFQRFNSVPNAALLWHSQETLGQVCMYLSTDESVSGRCSVVGERFGGRASQHITLVDARMTTVRVCQLVESISDATERQSNADGVTKHVANDLRRYALDGVLVRWPALPQARVPDVRVMSQSAPGPVRIISETCVSVAGGRIQIQLIDRDLMYRILQFDQDVGFDSSPYSPMVRACMAGLEDAVEVILVSQHGEPDMASQSWNHGGTERTFYAVSGVQMAHVFMELYPMHIPCRHYYFLEAFNNIPDQDIIVTSQLAKARYDVAVNTIRRFAQGNAFVRRVKEIAWRPDGRLAAKKMSEVVRR